MISCCATKLCQMNGPLPAMKFDSLGRSSPFRPSTLALILIHPSQNCFGRPPRVNAFKRTARHARDGQRQPPFLWASPRSHRTLRGEGPKIRRLPRETPKT